MHIISTSIHIYIYIYIYIYKSYLPCIDIYVYRYLAERAILPNDEMCLMVYRIKGPRSSSHR